MTTVKGLRNSARLEFPLSESSDLPLRPKRVVNERSAGSFDNDRLGRGEPAQNNSYGSHVKVSLAMQAAGPEPVKVSKTPSQASERWCSRWIVQRECEMATFCLRRRDGGGFIILGAGEKSAPNISASRGK